jgi:hypothetical protein
VSVAYHFWGTTVIFNRAKNYPTKNAASYYFNKIGVSNLEDIRVYELFEEHDYLLK